MSRVIQDSDDEFDNDLEVDVYQLEKDDASPKYSTSDASSTEALRKQIEAAHRAHLQSQFSANDGHTSVVAEGRSEKHKPSADVGSNSTSSEIFRVGIVPVTLGEVSNGIFTDPHSDKQEHQGCSGQEFQQTSAVNEVDWMLDGTMLEAYAQHKPDAMFPEPSSTVPNATLTQQRVLEGVLAPALLGSDIDAGKAAFVPDASIPWSEYLKSPADTGEQFRSTIQDPHVLQFTPTSEPPQDHSALLTSQRSQHGSVTLVGSSVPQDIPLGTIDTHIISVFTKYNNQSGGSPSSGLHQELPSSHSLSRNKRPGLELNLDDDLANLEFPTEQYKPRPSRSRSFKVGTQESIDDLKRFEKGRKASKRRRSVPAAEDLTKPPSTPNKIQQICDMGFTPSTSKKALQQNSGDIKQSLHWLIVNRIADDELVSHNLQVSSSGGYHGTRNTDTEGQRKGDIQKQQLGAEQAPINSTLTQSATASEDSASAGSDVIHHTSKVNVRSPAKVQVVIPSKPPKTFVETPAISETPRQKTKRRKTVQDLHEPITTTITAKGERLEKKRGRGRPRKAAKSGMSTETIQDDEDEASSEQMRDTLLAVEGNAHPSTVQVIVATAVTSSHNLQDGQPQYEATNTATTKTTPEPTVLPDRPEMEPLTPEHVKKLTTRERSSDIKAKVPLRVGLSKRARIAPLLRVVKK